MDSIAEYEKEGYEEYEGDVEETLFRTGISFKGNQKSICRMDDETYGEGEGQSNRKSINTGSKRESNVSTKLKKKAYLREKRSELGRQSTNHDVSAPEIMQDRT